MHTQLKLSHVWRLHCVSELGLLGLSGGPCVGERDSVRLPLNLHSVTSTVTSHQRSTFTSSSHPRCVITRCVYNLLAFSLSRVFNQWYTEEPQMQNHIEWRGLSTVVLSQLWCWESQFLTVPDLFKMFLLLHLNIQTKFGVSKIFDVFESSLFCSPRLHLFDHKYSKTVILWNIITI